MTQLILYIAILVAIYTTMAVPLNLMMGYGGLLSMTPVAAFFGIGAYATGVAATRWDVNFIVAILFAVAVSAVGAAVIAIPLLRLHDDYFVIGTLAFEVVISSVLLNWDSVTMGPIGLTGIPYASIFGLELDSYGTFIYLAVIVALIAILCTWRIAASPTAAMLRGIRDDEVAVTALGRNVRRLKVYITVYSAIWLGVGGALYAYLITALDSSQFSITTTIFIIGIVIVGGTGTVYGPILGAILLVPLPEILSFVGVNSDTASELRNIGYGLVLIVLMRLRPQGLLGERTTFRRQGKQPQLTPLPAGGMSTPPDGEAAERADVTS